VGHITFLARKPRAVTQFFGQDCLVEKLAESNRQGNELLQENKLLRAENQKLREAAATWRAAAKVAMDENRNLWLRLFAAEGRETRREEA